MFHTLGFGASMAAGATLAPLPPIPDQQIPANQNNQFILPANVSVMAAYVQGGALSRARFNTPSLRAVALPDIRPITVGGAPPSLVQLAFYYGRGPVLPKNDPLEIDVSNNAGAPDTELAVVLIGDNNLNIPMGQPYKVHGTSPSLNGGFAWQASALTLDQILPYGTYAVVGMNVQANNIVAGRLVFVGGGWRPGVVANIGIGDYPNPLFASGALGEYGRFESNAQPGVEVLCTQVTGTINWWLDLVKVI